MATLHTDHPLSTATNGAPLYVTQITHNAQLVHTADVSASDYVTLWVNNNHTTDVTVTTYVVANGVVTDANTPPASSIIVPAKSGKAVVEPGIRMTDSTQLRIIASVANVVSYQGYVYRRTEV